MPGKPPACRRRQGDKDHPAALRILSANARMPTRPEDGVVHRDHRVLGMTKLFIADGSTLPAQGAANPGLRIMALTAGAVDRLSAR